MSAPAAVAPRPERSARRGAHRGLAVLLAANAVAASGGAVAMVLGVLDLGPDVTPRLPFASPVLAALALAVVVAVPLGLAAGAAWRGEAQTADLVVGAGVLLLGWIVVQLAFIRTFSPFQPVYAALGAALVLWGRRLHRAGDAPEPERTRSTVVVAARCAVAVAGLLARHRLRLRHDRLGSFATTPDGTSLTVFRESVRLPDREPTERVSLVVWFHLRGIPPGAGRRARLFRRASLVNTVLFAGCTGFLVKRWVLDESTADWAGLYEWDTAEAADRYGRYITSILRPLSTPGSVGYEVGGVNDSPK